MTAKERLIAAITRPYVMQGESASAVSLEMIERERDYNRAVESVTVAFEDALVQQREACARFIEDQNRMVNILLGEKTEPGRHDAFVSDICKAIRDGKTCR